MNEIQVLCMVLSQLSVGGLLFAGLLPPRVIRPSFFILNCLISALAAALALVLAKGLLLATWMDVRYLGFTLVGATIAYGLFRLDKRVYGRFAMIVAALFGLVLGVLPLAANTLALRDIQTSAIGFFDASVLAGLFLLGVTHVGMILGHWYLLDRRMPFIYLERFTQLLIAAAVVRGLVLLVTVTMLDNFDPFLAEQLLPHLWSAGGKFFFFGLRVVLGIVLPFMLGIFILRCVRDKANQAATGLLYVAEICVLFGELFAAYLLI